MNNLIDTGAARSLLRLDVFKRLGRPHLLQPTSEVLRSLSNNIIQVCGITQLAVEGTPITVYVVPELSHELLLGDDSLRALKALVDFTSEYVILNGSKYSTVWDVSAVEPCLVETMSDYWLRRYPAVFASKGSHR